MSWPNRSFQYKQSISIVDELAEQRETIAKGILFERKPGESCYLIAMPWYQQWSLYVGMGTNTPSPPSYHPGQINNFPIIDPDQPDQLKPNLTERDFMAVPRSCWDLLLHSYSIHPSSVPIFVRFFQTIQISFCFSQKL